MLHSEQDARDISQETLTRALKSLHRYDLGRSFTTWVFRIARNACIDHLRKRKNRPATAEVDVIDTGLTPLETTASNRRAERLHQALGQLTPNYREIIILYHFEHLKYGEIAEALDIPMGTVMNRIFRARQKLRGLYESLGGDA